MKKVFSCVMSLLLLAAVVLPVIQPRAEVYADDGFNGASFQGNETEDIYFSYKEVDDGYIVSAVPQYANSSDYLNTCANTAGATAIGYYDRTYTNLIPDFEPGRYIRDIYMFYAQKPVIQEVINELYVTMGTNTVGNGTTANGFRNGLKEYINDNGYNVTYPSIVSGGAPNMTSIKNMIDNKQIAVLFVSGYTLLSTNDYSKTDTHDQLYKSIYKGSHVLIVFGYHTVKYYNTSGSMFRENTMLYVATGFPSDPLARILLDDNTNLHEGNIINLY